MDGRGLTGCRSAADAAWQSSDTALPIGQALLTSYNKPRKHDTLLKHYYYSLFS